jgi:hypothetical protein
MSSIARSAPGGIDDRRHPARLPSANALPPQVDDAELALLVANAELDVTRGTRD